MPNLILYNGKLLTQDPNIAHATALAIRDGRILAVGNDTEILELAASHTQQINLEGRRVIPGLTDSHIHFYEWALYLLGISLENTTSLDEVQKRVHRAAGETEPGRWILGQGWNQDLWSDPRLPNRFDLDVITPHNPTILWRTDLHLAWVNTLALETANITAETPDPDMGIIDRDATGQPTGILRELAINLVRRFLPQVSDEETDRAMRQAMKNVHKLGLTGVHDFRIMGGDDGPPALRSWQRLRADRSLDLRAWVMIPSERLAEAISLGLRTGFGDDFLRIGGIKLFADGAFGPRTAWMLEPFADAGTGMPLTPMEEITRKIALASQAGISTAVHAIGDRAVRELLDVFSEVQQNQQGLTQLLVPHRIEHVQHSHPDDLKRLAPMGLIASVQPLHLIDDMLMIEQAYSPRARWAYAFRDLLDAGTVLAFGSDCPVASPNPLLGIHAAVTRQRQDGVPDGGWYPSQCLTIREAVWGYTMGAAIASGQASLQGSISPGKFADFIVLDRDIFAISPEEIAETQVALTVFDGSIVFRSDAPSSPESF